MIWKLWTKRFWLQEIEIRIIDPEEDDKDIEFPELYCEKGPLERTERSEPRVLDEFSRRGIAVHEARIAIIGRELAERYDEKLTNELDIREAALANIRGY